jgi:predicted GNAT family N-acyltransferase
MKVTVRSVQYVDILRLRHKILRPRRSLITALFDADTWETTFHFGAYSTLGRKRLIGCVSFYEVPFYSEPAFQLCGMAVESKVQGKGVGQALLARAIESLVESLDVHLFWCNARESAVGFYTKQGWVVVSEQWEIPDVGPHYRMTKRI